MTVRYMTDANGKKTGVLLSMNDWEKVQQKLSEQEFYESFRKSVKEIKRHQAGKNLLKDAGNLLNEL